MAIVCTEYRALHGGREGPSANAVPTDRQCTDEEVQGT